MNIKPSGTSPVKLGEFSGTASITGLAGEWNVGLGRDAEVSNQYASVTEGGLYLKGNAHYGYSVTGGGEDLHKVTGGAELNPIGTKGVFETVVFDSITVHVEGEYNIGVGATASVAVPSSTNVIGAGGGLKVSLIKGLGIYSEVSVNVPKFVNRIKSIGNK